MNKAKLELIALARAATITPRRVPIGHTVCEFYRAKDGETRARYTMPDYIPQSRLSAPSADAASYGYVPSGADLKRYIDVS